MQLCSYAVMRYAVRGASYVVYTALLLPPFDFKSFYAAVILLSSWISYLLKAAHYLILNSFLS